MEIKSQWVTGFVDGEGTFYIGINRNPTMSSGYQVLPEFRIVQHKKDIKLLKALKDFFKSGVVRVNHDSRYELRIRSLDALNKSIIPHFNKNPLLTQKKKDFIKFKKIVDLMNKKEHLSISGLKKIIDLASEMNRRQKNKAQLIRKML